MSPNSVGLNDKYVFVKTVVLIWNTPYHNGDTVEKGDHHDLRMAIWPPYRLLSGADMYGFGWEYHNWLEISCLNVDYERAVLFYCANVLYWWNNNKTLIVDSLPAKKSEKII